jgi:hypothetical protein
MKHLKIFEHRKVKMFEQFFNEAIKFKLSDSIDNILNSIDNKKKAQSIESMIIKSLLSSLTPTYNFLKQHYNIEIDKNFNQLKTQQKLDYLFNNPTILSIINRLYLSKLTSISDYVNTNSIDKNDDFESLYNKSRIWHEEIANNVVKTDIDNSTKKVIREDETENTDKFITYPNGWYWINLNTSYSADEASNMGHCGRDANKILFSLRDKNSNSRVTVSYDVDENAMYQCKGRGNSKPKDEYHEYIINLLLNDKYPIDIIVTGSYRPDLDFCLTDLTEEELEELLSEKPSLEYTDNMFELYIKDKRWNNVASMIENGFDYNGEVVIKDMEFLKYIVNQKLNLNKYKLLENVKIDISLDMTEEDLDFYIENWKTLDNAIFANQLYILWKYGKVSSSEVESKIEDLLIKDGIWYAKLPNNSFSDLSFMFHPEERVDGRYSYTMSEYVSQNIDDDYYTEYNYDLSDCRLNRLNSKAIDKILNIIEHIEIEESEIEYLYEDFGFGTMEEWNISEVSSLIRKNVNLLTTLLEIDSMSDIKDNIIYGYEDAQRDADSNEQFKAFMNPILKEFKMEKFLYSDDNKIIFPIEPKYIFLIASATNNYYYLQSASRILEVLFDWGFREDAYDVYGIESGNFPSYLKIGIPYGGFSGSPSNDDISESVIEKL